MECAFLKHLQQVSIICILTLIIHFLSNFFSKSAITGKKIEIEKDIKKRKTENKGKVELREQEKEKKREEARKNSESETEEREGK